MGRKLWIKEYSRNSFVDNNSSGNNFCSRMVKISDTVFAFVLKTYGNIADSTILVTVTQNGNIVWSKGYQNAYGGALPNWTFERTNDHGFIMSCGGVSASKSSGSGFSIVKTDSAGSIQWAKDYFVLGKRFGKPIVETSDCSIKNASDGGYYFLGGGSIVSFPYSWYAVIKISAKGQLIWSKNFSGSGGSGFGGVGAPTTGDLLEIGKNLYFTGSATFYGVRFDKMDTSGNFIWIKDFLNLSYDNSMTFDAAKNQIVLATGDDTRDLGFIAMDTSGKPKGHFHLYPFTKTPNIFSVQTNVINNFIRIPTGYAMFSRCQADGFCVIKTDTAGNTHGCDTSSPAIISDTATYTSSIPVKDSVVDFNPSSYNANVTVSLSSSKDTVICPPFFTDFRWQDTCAFSPTYFYDSTFSGAVKWQWNFGDPGSGKLNITSAKNPVHEYLKGGKYKVTLISSNGINYDTMTKTVTIAAAPGLIVRDTAVCPGDSVSFTAATGTSYVWNNPGIITGNNIKSQSVTAYPYRDTLFTVGIVNSYGCAINDSFRLKIRTSCPGNVRISGIINHYSSVLSLDSCLASVTVDSIGSLAIGDTVMVMQMKGALIDTSNTASFGSIKSIGNAGKYEYNTIDSISGNSVFFKYKFQNKYDSGPSEAQLVKVPRYKNVLVDDTLRARPWDGIKGGVLALQVSGNIIMGAPIDVSGTGFRGGMTDSGSLNCKKTDYFYDSSSVLGARKGEGIAMISSRMAKGRGASGNGGGGGNSFDAGGGGGSNDTIGGNGGNEFAPCGSITNGGMGGFALHSYYQQGSIFAGGGGGAGYKGYASATNGASGGGICMISAASIAADGNIITANGQSQKLVAMVDGAGGAGAGGTILLDVKNLPVKLLLSANGGSGGNADSKQCTGPGGGGGGGVILLTSAAMPINLSASTLGGICGINTNNSSSCYLGTYGASSGLSGNVLMGYSVQKQSYAIANRPTSFIFVATVKDSSHIKLSFAKSLNPNMSGYKIYRAANNDSLNYLTSIYHPVSSPIIYNDAVNADKDSFSYEVFATDTCGDLTGKSLTHTTIHLSNQIKSCEQAIFLNWNAYHGWKVKNYNVYCSTHSGAEILLAKLPGAVLKFKDSAVNGHNTYCYRILATDSSGKDSSWSQKTCARPFLADTAKLISITKTTTFTTNGSVVIHWQNIKGQRYMSGANLYYSANGKAFNLIATLPSGQDSFVQSAINTQTSDGFYYIKNIDSCGNFSDSSIVHKTMTLTVKVGQLTHQLNWTPYQGFKIKNYKIQRFENGQFVTIDSVPGNDTASKEFPAPCNYAIYYRIVATGYNPGEVSWSDTSGHKALDTLPPNAAKINSLIALDANHAQLNFTTSDSPDVYKYIIEKNTGGNWSGKDYINSLHHANSSYTDTLTPLGPREICYTIITFDSCLNAAESDTICVENITAKSLFCKAQVELDIPKMVSPPALPDSFVILRSTDAINYRPTLKSQITNHIALDTDVTVGTRYYYKLEMVYNRANMASYSDTLSITPRIIPQADSAQLVYASVLKSDETQGQIYIVWRRAPKNDTNARGYYVYSYNSANGKYTLVKNITNLSDTSFINTGINTLKNSYKYYVITYNVCDVGINSNTHRTVLLTVQNNDLSESLKWINYLGVPVRSYSVYKSVDGGGQVLLSNTGIDSSLSDSNISCGHNYTYQVQAMLANGEISNSDSVTVKSFDTIRPITNAFNYVTVDYTGVTDGKIKLNWLAAKDKNLQGYNIYRSTDGLYWSLIPAKGGTGIDHWSSTSFTDSGLNTYRQSYYYKIQPVDSCGNTGAFTIYHLSMNLRTKSGNGYNSLTWNGYEGWPVKYYLIYKDGVIIDTIKGNAFNYKDTAVICKQVYHYLIKAIDADNDTILSLSNTDSAKGTSSNPPQKVYIKTVTVSTPNKSAFISWTASKSYDVKDYLVYRKDESKGNMALVNIVSSTQYLDSNLSLSSPLGVRGLADEGSCYYVFARDHCGNISDGSNEGCIIILNAQNQPGYNQLSWNGYQDWPDGVQSYNVYKNEDSTGWNLIGTVSSPLLGRGAGGEAIGAFTDNKLGDSTIDYCYQIKAIENPGQYNQVSRSTEICVHQGATVFIPNSFTPYDANGLNDYFAPQGIHIKSYEMRIYNRWGECVYASPKWSVGTQTTEGVGWDGTFRGQLVQQGVYMYFITVTDYNGKQSYFKGNVTIFQ